MAKPKRSSSLGSLGTDEEDLLRRAGRAWLALSPAQDWWSSDSAAEHHGAHWYVVLRGGSGPSDVPMAVYRLKNDGVLRRLRRWPASIQP